MRIAVIANPISGRGRSLRQVRRLVEAAENAGHEVDLLLSEAAGDPHEIASRLDSSIDRLVVAGGDGTLNEVLNGLVDPARVPIALLPSGTANLLARELTLPKTPSEVIQVLEHGTVRRLDLGMVNERRFLLVLSVGFDAMVIEEIHRTRDGRLGFRGYIGPVIRAARRYVPPKLRVTIDDEAPIDAAWAVVSNVRKYAGLFCIADRAECDSGCLDVCLFPKASGIDLVRYAVAARRERVSKLAGVCYRNAQRIRIDADEPTMVEIDGEFFGVTPLDIRVTARCVPILTTTAPPKTNGAVTAAQ